MGSPNLHFFPLSPPRVGDTALGELKKTRDPPMMHDHG